MAELKPCPFCGGEAKLHHRMFRPLYAVVCKDTKCQGHNLYVLHYSEKEAVDAWNRRAGDTE
jgi:Lar family restriction alleviation protein